MSKISIFLLLLCNYISQAQVADRITFSYDNAGNQIQRILCINCTTSKMSNESIKEIAALEELEEEDLLKFSEQDVISYYPNPVKEELYLQWELMEGNYVTSIMLYDMNGRVLQSFSNLDTKNNQNITFQSYPIGMYAVVLFYKKGEQKSIKIIKK